MTMSIVQVFTYSIVEDIMLTVATMVVYVVSRIARVTM